VRLVINCDLDGVVVDFNTEMRVMTEMRVRRALSTFDRWKVWEVWDMTFREWQDHFNTNVELGMFGRCDEIEGAVKSLIYLTTEHRVRFITNKALDTPKLTMKAQHDVSEWLERRDLIHAELIFAKDKQGYPADIVIDDNPAMDWTQSGARNLLFDQPWNADVEQEESGPIWKRVFAWSEILDVVDRVSGMSTTARV